MDWQSAPRTAAAVWLALAIMQLAPSATAFAGKLPPGPARPRLAEQTQQAAAAALDSDDYQQRERASEVLAHGGAATVETLRNRLEEMQPEGRLRALEVAQKIYLEELARQNDEEAETVRRLINEMRLADNELLGSRVDVFNVIHQWALERASIRNLIRSNMVIEFRQANRSFPGLTKRDITSELPERFFLGENWQGDDDDLRHIEYLLMLGEQQLGSQRAIYRIQGCPVPLDRLQDLAAGLQVTVDERGQARLGVGARPQLFVENPPWEVTEVSPGSAAAHAGIKSGDTIVRLNGESLNTFQELTERLEAYKPADEVTIDVLSNDAEAVVVTLEKPVDLAELGLKIDNNFARFTIVSEVEEDSQAAKAGLSEMYRIDRINGQAVNGPHNFRLIYTMQKADKPVTMEMRVMKRLPVTLRGWVGPYR